MTFNSTDLQRICLTSSSLVPLLALTSCAIGQGPAVEKFYRTLEAGDYAQVQGMLSKSVASKVTPAQVSRRQQQIRECGGYKDIAVKETGKAGDVYKGYVQLTYIGPCPSQREDFYLVRSDGDWKVTFDKNGMGSPSIFEQQQGRVQHERKFPKLHDGDLVFRSSDDMVSRLILSFSVAPKYSHVGMVVIRDNIEYVVHAIPSQGVIMESITSFAPAAEPLAVFRVKELPDDSARRMKDYAVAHLRVNFDEALRLSDDSTMYCSELVRNALRAGGSNFTDLVPTVTIASLPEPVLLPDMIWRSPQLEGIAEPLERQP